MKKVLILSGSPRKNGNSDMLCDEFMKGAIASGNCPASVLQLHNDATIVIDKDAASKL